MGGAAALAPRRRSGDHQDSAAGGAGGMGPEPRVDATGMEPVAALRQDADHVAVGELGEADGAVDQLNAAAGSVGGGGGVG